MRRPRSRLLFVIAIAVLLTLTTVERGIAESARPILDVRELGAVGDGHTDDSRAFGEAQRLATQSGGAIIHVPPTAKGYVIGDGRTKGTAIAVTSGTRWVGDGARLIHRAKNLIGQNTLFYVRDATDVEIENFEIDGEGAIRVGVFLTGVILNAAVRDLWLHDLRNFAIVYGGPDRNPDTAYFDGLILENIRIDGKVGRIGDGSGINIFPRSQRGSVPAARNLQITNLKIDVSHGHKNAKQHGPQGLKINNVDGAVVTDLCLVGGAVSGVTLINGVRNARLRRVHIRHARNGITVGSSNNIVSTKTQSIDIADVVVLAPAQHQGRRVGMRIIGIVPRITAHDAHLAGDILIESSDVAGSAQELTLSNISMPVDGRLRLADARSSADRAVELPAGGASGNHFPGLSPNSHGHCPLHEVDR